MKVILYSTNCPKCKQLERKLNTLGVKYEICYDLQPLIDAGFKSAPILKVEDKFFEFASAWKKAEELV